MGKNVREGQTEETNWT